MLRTHTGMFEHHSYVVLISMIPGAPPRNTYEHGPTTVLFPHAACCAFEGGLPLLLLSLDCFFLVTRDGAWWWWWCGSCLPAVQHLGFGRRGIRAL